MSLGLTVLLLLVVSAAAPVVDVDAQQWDPAATITAYSTALNAHDVAAALALFDEYGSATDAHGHHFEGRDGLTTFLLANGFGGADASVSTQHLQVVANRAFWTYTCSCAVGSADVRIVLNHDKISVFAVIPPASSPMPTPRTGVPQLAWLVGLGLLVVTLAVALGLRSRQSTRPLPPSSTQGRLLVALRQAHQKSWGDQ